MQVLLNRLYIVNTNERNRIAFEFMFKYIYIRGRSRSNLIAMTSEERLFDILLQLQGTL